MKPTILKTPSFTLAILQLNFKVGDIPYNSDELKKGYRKAVAMGATFVMAPELAISGYPPKDNLLHTAFVAMCKRVSEEVAAEVGAIPLAFGTPWPTKKLGDYGQKAYNRYVVACNGKIVFFTDKVYPAQGGVFDEHRVHVVGKPKLFRYQGLKIGFPICEDIWHDPVVEWLDEAGADIFLVPNGSPTYVGKPAVRQKIVARHAKRTGKPMLYLNHVGGQDEHAFDGGAFFVNPASGKAMVFAPYWQEAVQLLTIVKKGTWRFEVPKGQPVYEEPSSSDYILDALVLTTRDYLLKATSLRKVIIGISGGVDSAVVLGLAVLMFKDMGLNPAENIIAVSMPTKHNTEITKGFAQQVCNNLGIPLHWWPIGDAVESLKTSFESHFEVPLKLTKNAAYENTQSRERGQVLMMLSNRFNALLLSTGNKSEMAMGYATLYGDMNGGFNPLKTVYKTQVCEELAPAINKRLAELGYTDEAILNRAH